VRKGKGLQVAVQSQQSNQFALIVSSSKRRSPQKGDTVQIGGSMKRRIAMHLSITDEAGLIGMQIVLKTKVTRSWRYERQMQPVSKWKKAKDEQKTIVVQIEQIHFGEADRVG
jgi:hypothetical protein